MTPLLERIASDPNLLAAAVFVVCLVGAGLFAAVWFALFGQGDRQLRRRVEQLHAPRAVGAAQAARPVESLRRNRSDSSIAGFDRMIKRFLPNIGLLRLRLARSLLALRLSSPVNASMAWRILFMGMVFLNILHSPCFATIGMYGLPQIESHVLFKPITLVYVACCMRSSTC